MTESSVLARLYGEGLVRAPLVTIGGEEILLGTDGIRAMVNKNSGPRNAQVAVDPITVVADVSTGAEYYWRNGYGFLTQRPTHYIISALLFLSSLAALGIWLGMRLKNNA